MHQYLSHKILREGNDLSLPVQIRPASVDEENIILEFGREPNDLTVKGYP